LYFIEFLSCKPFSCSPERPAFLFSIVLDTSNVKFIKLINQSNQFANRRISRYGSSPNLPRYCACSTSTNLYRSRAFSSAVIRLGSVAVEPMPFFLHSPHHQLCKPGLSAMFPPLGTFVTLYYAHSGSNQDGILPQTAVLARISDAMSDRAARSEPSDRLRSLTVVPFRI
jgi:hypothetical protein